MAGYWDEHAELRTDGPAQGGQWFAVTEHPDHWDIHQVLLDPDEDAGWSLDAQVDLVRSREEEPRRWSWCASDERLSSSPSSNT